MILPLSIFIEVWMLEAVTFIFASADIFPVYPVATTIVLKPVGVKYAHVPILLFILVRVNFV